MFFPLRTGGGGNRPFRAGGPAGEPDRAIVRQFRAFPNGGHGGIERLDQFGAIERSGIGESPAVPAADGEPGGGGVERDGFFPLAGPSSVAGGDDENTFGIFRRVIVCLERTAGEFERQDFGGF